MAAAGRIVEKISISRTDGGESEVHISGPTAVVEEKILCFFALFILLPLCGSCFRVD